MHLVDDMSLTFAEWRAQPLGLKVKLAGAVVIVVLLRPGTWPRGIIEAILVAATVGLIALFLSGRNWVVVIVAAGGSIAAEATPKLSRRRRQPIDDD